MKKIFLILLILVGASQSNLLGQSYNQKQSSPKKSTPIFANAKFIKAKEYYYSGRFTMARVFLRDLTLDYSEDFEIYTYLGDCDFALKDYKQALVNYKKANELLGDNPESKKIKAQNYYMMGRIYHYLENADESIAHFELAAMTDASMVAGLFEKGVSSLILNRDKASAIAAWQEYADLIKDENNKKKIQIAIQLLQDPNFHLPRKSSRQELLEVLQLAGIQISPPSLLEESPNPEESNDDPKEEDGNVQRPSEK